MDDKLNVDILEETIKAFKVLGKECIRHIYKAAYNEAIEDACKIMDKEHEVEPQHIPVRITRAMREILKLKKE